MILNTFFRLPVIAFWITFYILSGLFIYRFDYSDYGSSFIPYYFYYLAIFVANLGFSLLVLFVISISVLQLNIYLVNWRNLLFVIILTGLLITINQIWQAKIDDFFIAAMNSPGYDIPLIYCLIEFVNFIGGTLITFLLAIEIASFIKSRLPWQEQPDFKAAFSAEQIAEIQLIYFSVLFLAMSFIFQSYLYMTGYFILYSRILTEVLNLFFYGASILLIWLFARFIRANNPQYQRINWLGVVKTVVLILFSQLILSLIFSPIIIFCLENSYLINLTVFPNDNFLIGFVIVCLTFLSTYFAGKFWLRRSHFLS